MSGDVCNALCGWCGRCNRYGDGEVGQPKPVRLHCTDCTFIGSLKEAYLHYAETGHQLMYRGVVQDMAGVR